MCRVDENIKCIIYHYIIKEGLANEVVNENFFSLKYSSVIIWGLYSIHQENKISISFREWINLKLYKTAKYSKDNYSNNCVVLKILT